MFCSSCGQAIESGSLFCRHCGASVAPAGCEQTTPDDSGSNIADHSTPATANLEGKLPVAEGESPEAPPSDIDHPLTQFWRAYYWANLIINPLLVLLVLAAEDVEAILPWSIGWLVVSGIMNPRLRGCAVSLGGALGVAVIAAGCGLLGLGSIAAIVAAIILIGFVGGFIGLAILVFLDVALWIIALMELLKDRRLSAAQNLQA